MIIVRAMNAEGEITVIVRQQRSFMNCTCVAGTIFSTRSLVHKSNAAIVSNSITIS